MISDAPITAILPVQDQRRAAAFYRDQLGLADAGQAPDGNHMLRTGSGAMIALMSAEPGAQSGHTVLSFEVDQIGTQIRDLESKGVTFQDYDLPDLKTVDHICVMGSEKAAWFADPEGNILCLHEQDMG